MANSPHVEFAKTLTKENFVRNRDITLMKYTSFKGAALASALFTFASTSAAFANPLYDDEGWKVTTIPAKGDLRQRCQLQRARTDSGPLLRLVELPRAGKRQLVVILSPVEIQLEGKGGSINTSFQVDKNAAKPISMRWRKGRKDAIALSYSETDINGFLKTLARGYILSIKPENSNGISLSLKGSAKAIAILDNCMRDAAGS